MRCRQQSDARDIRPLPGIGRTRERQLVCGSEQCQPDRQSESEAGNLASRAASDLYITPAWLEGFDASLDWYDIRIRNAIGDPGDQATVYDCYARNSDAACALITRASDGTIFHVTDFPQNVPGGVETEGYDIALTYRHDTPIGRISARWNTNYVDYFGEIGKPAPGSPLPDGSTAQGNVVGLNSPNLAISSLFGVIWRLRSQLQLVWDRAPWSASITGRYFSHIDEDCSVVINTALQLGNPSLDESMFESGSLDPDQRQPGAGKSRAERDLHRSRRQLGRALAWSHHAGRAQCVQPIAAGGVFRIRQFLLPGLRPAWPLLVRQLPAKILREAAASRLPTPATCCRHRLGWNPPISVRG